jgi:hypothetical protein
MFEVVNNHLDTMHTPHPVMLRVVAASRNPPRETSTPILKLRHRGQLHHQRGVCDV